MTAFLYQRSLIIARKTACKHKVTWPDRAAERRRTWRGRFRVMSSGGFGSAARLRATALLRRLQREPRLVGEPERRGTGEQEPQRRMAHGPEQGERAGHAGERNHDRNGAGIGERAGLDQQRARRR